MKDSGRDQPVLSHPEQLSRERPLVLVTDDHADTRLLFRTMLGMRGYSVIEAADGEQAVLRAESAAPDLILMDGSLPAWGPRVGSEN